MPALEQLLAGGVRLIRRDLEFRQQVAVGDDEPARDPQARPVRPPRTAPAARRGSASRRRARRSSRWRRALARSAARSCARAPGRPSSPPPAASAWRASRAAAAPSRRSRRSADSGRGCRPGRGRGSSRGGRSSPPRDGRRGPACTGRWRGSCRRRRRPRRRRRSPGRCCPGTGPAACGRCGRAGSWSWSLRLVAELARERERVAGEEPADLVGAEAAQPRRGGGHAERRDRRPVVPEDGDADAADALLVLLVVDREAAPTRRVQVRGQRVGVRVRARRERAKLVGRGPRVPGAGERVVERRVREQRLAGRAGVRGRRAGRPR